MLAVRANPGLHGGGVRSFLVKQFDWDRTRAAFANNFPAQPAMMLSVEHRKSVFADWARKHLIVRFPRNSPLAVFLEADFPDSLFKLVVLAQLLQLPVNPVNFDLQLLVCNSPMHNELLNVLGPDNVVGSIVITGSLFPVAVNTYPLILSADWVKRTVRQFGQHRQRAGVLAAVVMLAVRAREGTAHGHAAFYHAGILSRFHRAGECGGH